MEYVIVVVVLAALLVVAPMVRDALKRRRDRSRYHKEIVATEEGYAFLIDSGFEVEDTNYYQLNKDVEKKPPYVLGNVLHCKNGIDCGLCGTGFACQSCPVRMVIKNSFIQKRDFNNIEADMDLYDAEQHVQHVNVKVDGRLVSVGGDPHMLIKVGDASNG